MNEPYVLSALKRHLNPAHPFGVLNESAPIVKSLVGVSPEAKEMFLKKNRLDFLGEIKSGSEEEVAFRIEGALDMMAEYWKDASSTYYYGNDGIGMDGVTWSLIKTYFFEALNYTADLYRLHLLHPTDELYDIEGKFESLKLDQVHQIIIDSGLMSQKRLNQLEQKAEKTPKENPSIGGKILGIPWSGVDEIDSISQYFEDSSSLNMGVITEMGKQFRKLCRSKARDKYFTRDEKIIWIRAVVNALNALYIQANRSNMNMIFELSALYCAIVEEEFMQIPEPICVKEIAIEIEATDIFDDVVFLANASPEGSTIPCTYNRFLLTEDMGEANLELYEKKMCENCEIQNCPYDIYMRKYQEDGIGIPGKYYFGPQEAEETKPISYIDDCHNFFCDPEIVGFLDAVCISLSITPKWQHEEFDEKQKMDFIDKHIAPRSSYYYRYSEELAQELTDHVKCLKSDELALSNFIDDFLSPFYELATLINPRSLEGQDLLRSVVFTCASGLVNCPLTDFPKIMADSFDVIKTRHEYEDFDAVYDLIKEVLSRAPGKDNTPKDRIFAAIHEIKTSLSLVEAALEAALLNAGVENDYIYYEKEVGINMGRWVNEIELYLVTRKTPHSIVARIKKLGHSTRYGIRPDEDMYDYVKRYFGEDDSGVAEHPSDTDKAESVSSEFHSDVEDNASSSSSDIATDTSGNQSPSIELPDNMQECLKKAKDFFKDGRWWNSDKKMYAIFLKVLYCTVYEKSWDSNVRWVDLPIVPLRNGTLLSIPQLKGALRKRNDVNGKKYRMTFENLFNK